jgi:hypothetical protein
LLRIFINHFLSLLARSPLHLDTVGEGTEEDGGGAAAEGYDAAGPQGEEAEAPRFGAREVEEARKMIERLIVRTEAALNKHHDAKKRMLAQENRALSDAVAQNASAVALTGACAARQEKMPWSVLWAVVYCIFMFLRLVAGGLGGLAKISTMELIKETVDQEEQSDLEELYFLWDEAIQLYEIEEFPGDYEVISSDYCCRIPLRVAYRLGSNAGNDFAFERCVVLWCCDRRS